MASPPLGGGRIHGRAFLKKSLSLSIMRSDFSLSVNLLLYKGAELTERDGKRGVFIPIEGNSLFEGEQGVWQNLQAIEHTRLRFNTTHFIKRQIYKEEAAKMTKEEKKNQTILGYMKPLFFKKSEKKDEKTQK